MNIRGLWVSRWLWVSQETHNQETHSPLISIRAAKTHTNVRKHVYSVVVGVTRNPQPPNIYNTSVQPRHETWLQCVAVECVAVECVAVDCVAVECVAVECVAVECVAVECVAVMSQGVAAKCVAVSGGFPCDRDTRHIQGKPQPTATQFAATHCDITATQCTTTH